MSDDIHSAGLAGRWYPADRADLRSEVERLLGEPCVDPALRAVIVPHAGYAYSGRVAGAGFARIERGRWRRAVVVAPSHFHRFDGAAVFPGKGFRTPLGVVAIDREAAARLAARPPCALAAAPYAGEHSLEIELPFLQLADPALPVVPVLVGAGDEESTLAAIGRELRLLDDGHSLFVVSSDFTHYGEQFDYLPFPPDDPATVASEIRALDFGAIEPIRRGDPEAFADYVERTGITVCGRGPIRAFLHLAAGALAGELVSYATSLDVTGDHEHSVSYASIAFHPASAGVG